MLYQGQIYLSERRIPIAMFFLFMLFIARPSLSAPGGWVVTYGGVNPDGIYSIQQTVDGGYIVVGNTESFGAGKVDAWVLKLRPDGSINPSCGFGRDTSVSGKDSNAKVEATSAIAIDSGANPQDPAFRSQTIIDILINGICP